MTTPRAGSGHATTATTATNATNATNATYATYATNASSSQSSSSGGRDCFGIAVYNVVTATSARGTAMQMTSATVAALCLGVGILMAVAGRWLLTPTLLVAGCAAGVGVAYTFMQDEWSADVDLCSNGLMFAAVCGVVGGTLFVAVWRCAFRLVVFVSIIAFLQQIAVTFFAARVGDTPVFLGVSVYPHWIGIVGTALAMTCVLGLFPTQKEILTTCLLGAWATLAGLKGLTTSEPLQDWIYAIVAVFVFVSGCMIQNAVRSRCLKSDAGPGDKPTRTRDEGRPGGR